MSPIRRAFVRRVFAPSAALALAAWLPTGAASAAPAKRAVKPGVKSPAAKPGVKAPAAWGSGSAAVDIAGCGWPCVDLVVGVCVRVVQDTRTRYSPYKCDGYYG